MKDVKCTTVISHFTASSTLNKVTVGMVKYYIMKLWNICRKIIEMAQKQYRRFTTLAIWTSHHSQIIPRFCNYWFLCPKSWNHFKCTTAISPFPNCDNLNIFTGTAAPKYYMSAAPLWIPTQCLALHSHKLHRIQEFWVFKCTTKLFELCYRSGKKYFSLLTFLHLITPS